MSQDDRDLHAHDRFEAFLASPAHHTTKAKPEHPDDPVIDTESVLGPPDWHSQGKDAPPGWKALGDTFVEE